MSNETRWPPPLRQPSAPPPPSGTINRAAADAFARRIRDEQSLRLGFLAGVVAAGIGAALWALITAATNYQIGFMALGVGFLVGHAVRVFGKGVDTGFGVLGAVLALAGCLAGNLLAACIIASREMNVPLSTILGGLTPALATRVLTATFQVMDLLFYALAVYEGYRFSFRRITEAETRRLTH